MKNLKALQAAWKAAEAKEQGGGFAEFEPDREMLSRLGECSVKVAKTKNGEKWLAKFPFEALTGVNKGKKGVFTRFLEGKDDTDTLERLAYMKAELNRVERDLPDDIEDLPEVIASLSGEGVAICVKVNGDYTNFYMNELVDVSSLCDGEVRFEGGETVSLDSMDRAALEELAASMGLEVPKDMADNDVRDLIEAA